jgi:hypothetical protein
MQAANRGSVLIAYSGFLAVLNLLEQQSEGFIIIAKRNVSSRSKIGLVGLNGF